MCCVLGENLIFVSNPCCNNKTNKLLINSIFCSGALAKLSVSLALNTKTCNGVKLLREKQFGFAPCFNNILTQLR